MPRRGRCGRRKLQGPTAFAAANRLLSPTTQRASLGAQPMGTEPGKKGARVRMRLRKAMLPAQGQRAVHPARQAVRGPHVPSSDLLASPERQPYFSV